MNASDADVFASLDDGGRVSAWLDQMSERRDLGLAVPDDTRARAVVPLLDALSDELASYAAVVTDAREAAQQNARGLEEIVRSTGEQGVIIRATADAATQAGSGAALMAGAVEALAGYAAAAAGAAGDARTNLGAVDAALDELARRLREGDTPLGEMRRSIAGVNTFLTTLARLSRHAQLLAVNAEIEAAHLAQGGSRFGIVAAEVRKLSASTRDSKSDVAHIVTELREATGRVASATNDSKDATDAATRGVAGAGEALSRTAADIGRFESMVAEIADVTATQSMALDAIGASVDQIAHHADEAANASRSAAKLSLQTLLERAQRSVARWSARRAAGAHGDSDARLAQWIGEILGGVDPAEPTAFEREPAYAPVVKAVRTLVARINADERAILADVVEVAVAVAHNSYAWRSIGESLDGIQNEIRVVRETVDESAVGARTSAALAGATRELVTRIHDQYDAALALLEGALERVARITSSVAEINGFVESMTDAAARADNIMTLIETLSSETDLLSLNAAIEAAHAGELGLGFSVIAEEIRALARSTNESTLRVTEMVTAIIEISRSLTDSIVAAASRTSDVTASADGVRGAIAALRGAFESASGRTADVSTLAAEQTRALETVVQHITRGGGHGGRAATEVTDSSRLRLAQLGSSAHAIAARRPLGTVIERVRDLGEGLCTSLEAVYESALTTNRITREQLFRFEYHPIAGAEIATLGRLFDVARVPEGGFTPPKYATPWDAAVDERLNDVLERFYDAAEAFKPVTIFISDLNGFFYAYPRRKIAAWADDPAKDNLGNRIKRMFEDEYALRVGRLGLGDDAPGLGTRVTYDRFQAAGCTLRRAARRPWGGFVYARDTSAVCNEVAMALYVEDMRHSTLRICYDPSLI